jgi:TIR domain
MKRTVFISHSSKDKAIGDEICRFLETNGISCWIAPRNVMPGKNYGAAIVEAIDECAVFLLVLTNESNKSGQVVREVERAASANAVIIPLRVEPVPPSRDLEFYVSSSHWLDATEKPLAKHLGKLLDAIKNWKTGDEPAPERTTPETFPTSSPPTRRSNWPLMLTCFLIGAVIVLGAFVYLAVRPSSNHETAPLTTSTPASTGTAITTSPSANANAGESSLPTAAANSTGESRSDQTVAPALPTYIRDVTASSMLHDTFMGKTRVHSPNHVFDGNLISVWIPTTSGVGEWIMVHFKSPMSITSVSIFGGAGIDKAHYQNHNRVREMRMTFDDGTTETLTFEDKMQFQRFKVRHPGMVESVKFEILAVFPGAKFDQTSIAEIAFNRD